MYSPEVSFTDSAGQTITFTSNISSSMPTYHVGQKVSVLYNKNNSQDAKINTFFQLWFVTIIMSFLGVVFFLVGLLFLIAQKKRAALEKELLYKGTKISTKVVSVQTNAPTSSQNSFMGQGSRPGMNFFYGTAQRPTYQIVAQWLNLADNQMYIIKSDDLSYDPGTIVSGKNIDVYIDPQNPKRYYMDISSLPKVAN